MKKSSKTLKIMLVVLIIALISIISFVGIYDKSGNNAIRDYVLGKNIEGSIIVKYVPSSLKEESTQDEDKQEEEEQIEENEDQEEIQNEDTTLTKENFLKSKKILQSRLEALDVNDYEIRLNEETGEIYISLPDDSNKDSAMEVLSYVGSFEIKDSETDEVLLNNDDIESAKVGYGQASSSSTGTSAFLTITFNKEGKQKLLDISNEYVKSTDEEGNETEKKVSLTIEDEEVVSTSFTEPLTNGMIQLTIGSSTTDTSELRENIKQGSKVAITLDNGKLPLKYTVENEEFIKSEITQNEIMMAVYILAGVAGIDIIYFILKYKKNGILSMLSYISSIAILLLLIRYTNTVIVLESIVAFLSLIILSHYLYSKVLNNIDNSTNSEKIKKAFKEVYKSSLDLLIVLLIISVVFVYASLTSINSIGMILFWGIISIVVSNYVFGRTLLISNAQK